MILGTLNRFLLSSRTSYIRSTKRLSSSLVATITRGPFATQQVEHIRASLNNNKDWDWNVLKTEILGTRGSLNEKNVDGVLLKIMISENYLDAALSFAKYVTNSSEELNIGVTNGLLSLYYQIGLEKQLTNEQKQFILNTYKKLYEKYEVLDASTCECLLHALCAIDEWGKALKVLDDLHLSSKPTHSAYSFLIATLFKLDKKKEALTFIEKSIQNQRPLTPQAYEAWIDYIYRQYKTKKTRLKHLEEICTHLSMNCVVLPEKAADKLKYTFHTLGWRARLTRIHKSSGQCVYCRSTLECLKLTEKEFQLLQDSVKDKLIVGSDLLLKSSEPELKRFLDFFKETAPYDIVLDALNICYAVGRHKMDKIGHLTFVVEHFRQQNKKILLIGKKHMLKWPNVKYVLGKTLNFFTDDVSQDDPYFITATILSGSHTDFVSKDLLRGHRFQLQDEQLRHLFQRWQWQHQWKVFLKRNGTPVIQPPLPVTPCAQKTGPNWHLPFELEEPTNHGGIKDGTPDWASWLCLQPSIPEEIDQNTGNELKTHNGLLKEVQQNYRVFEGEKKPFKMNRQLKSPIDVDRRNGQFKGMHYNPPKEIGLQNNLTKEIGLQSNPPKEIGLQSNPSKEIGLRNSPPKEIGLQNNPPKQIGLQKNPPKQIGLQSNPLKERGLQSSPLKEIGLESKIGLQNNPLKEIGLQSNPLSEDKPIARHQQKTLTNTRSTKSLVKLSSIMEKPL